MSVDNCRLFIGGIPKRVSKDDIRAEMEKVTDGVVDVIVYPSASDKTKNRGYMCVYVCVHNIQKDLHTCSHTTTRVCLSE